MNKNQTWRKVLSLLCAMVMLVGIMVVGSVVASAAETEYVAYIGEQGYDSLASAVEAADSGDTIYLVADCSETVSELDKTLTIDGNGNTFSGKITTTDGTLTIQNATLVTNGGFVVVTNSDVVIDNCTITSTVSGPYYSGTGAVNAKKANCDVTITNCTISKLYYPVYFNQGGTSLTIDSCEITDCVYISSSQKCPTVNIKNVNYTGLSGLLVKIDTTNKLAVNFENVSIKTTLSGHSPLLVGTNNPQHKVVVTVTGINKFVASDGSDTITTSTDATVTTVPCVGVIDKTLYETAAEFEAALKALKNHLHEDHAHKIVLGQDCNVDFDIGEHRANGDELGAHVTLDLNGYEYTGEITLHNKSDLLVLGIEGEPTFTVKECDQKLTKVWNTANHWKATRHDLIVDETLPTCTVPGKLTYTCSSCNYSYWIENAPATGVHNFEFVETVAPTTEAGGYDLYKCADCDATDKRNPTDRITAVASVNGVVYETVAAALEAAANGQTVYIIANVTENVTVNKSITLDGQNNKYTGTMTVNKGLTITIQNVKFVNGGIDKPKAQKSTTGVYNIYDCSFDGEGVYSYPLRFQGANTIDVQRCTVENYLYSFLYVVSSTTNVYVYDVTVDGGNSYGVYFASGVTNATFEKFTVKNNPRGFLINNTVDRSFTIKNCKMENVGTAIAHSSGTNAIVCTISGNENDFGGAALSEYANVIFADAATTLVANAGFEFATSVANSCVYFADGVYSVKAHTYKDTVTPPTTESQGFTTHTCENCGDSYVDTYVPVLSYVAEVNGVKYTTIQAAINAAANGQTVYLIDDVTENVTIKYSITLDGQNYKYTGTMTVNAGLTITIQNVNFVNGGILKSTGSTTGKYTVTNCTFDGANNTYAYAFSIKGANTVIIENCSVKDYMYGFLYVRSGVITVTVKNVSVENCPNYAVYFASGVNNASFEKFTVKNANRGFLINNTANRTLTVKDCVMEDVNKAVAESSGTLTITCKLLGENNFGGAALSDYARVLLGATDAKLAALETLNVGVAADLAANYRAVFAEGTWSVKEIDFVAQVGTQKYESLQAAIDAAADGQIVIMLKNVEYTIDDALTTEGYAVLVKVEGKSITLDMNGKAINVVHESTTNRIFAVVFVADGAGLTVTGNGTIDVLANETTPKVAYMFWKRGTTGHLNIESGYFHMNNSEDSMVYTNGDRIVTVSGGTFVIDKVGTRPNGFPPIFNTQGQNTKKIVVTGGSFNVDVNHQYYCFEVQVDKTLAVAYRDGMWTVVPAVAYIGEIKGEYIHNVGYATIEEAYARAVELGNDGFSALVIFADDTLKSANLFVGSYINVYFNVYKSSFSSAFKYTAYVYDANGNEVAAIPSNLWETHEGSEDLYKINFKNLAAKQMADEFKLVIVCDDERVSLSDNTVDSFSVKSYVENGWDSFTAEQKQLLSAMLAYGSAAQDAFGYNTTDKADDVTVDLPTVTPVPDEYVGDYSVAMRDYYYGASLTLENTVYFNFKFFADSVEGAAYAVITDENGNELARVDAANFRTETKQGKTIVVVTFDASVANATQLAKCTFYTAEDTEIVSAQDNILSYCYRAIEGITASGYTGSFGVEFYTALANYAYAVSTYSAFSIEENI